MNWYQIAGINISISWEKEEEKQHIYAYHDCIILPRVMEAFGIRQINKAQVLGTMNVRVHGIEEIEINAKSRQVYNQRWQETEDKKILTMYDLVRGDQMGYSIMMAKDYSQVDYLPHCEEYNHYDLQWLIYPFECRMLYLGGIVLHGAAIEYKAQGIIFSGVSGAGKSTQAHLWQYYREALILNGDAPAIHDMDGIPRVYGTPWCGSSEEAINRSIPLKAVILVKKGEVNKIRKLDEREAVLALFSNTFHMNFDLAVIDFCMAYIQKLVKHIEVYELTCRVDEGAVEVVQSAIFKEK